MLMKTEKKEVYIVLRTRKIAKLTEKLKGNNLNEIFFKGQRDCNPTTLGIFIESFAETEDGKSAFGSVLDVYDFIDDYRRENEKSYEDIYKELAVEINDMGFFKKKMTMEELEKTLMDPIGDININQIVNQVTEKEIGKAVEKEFRGYKA